MKTLIVYYSLEGNTDYAAKRIAERIGADTLRLIPKKAYADKGFAKFFWGGKSSVMAEKPALEPFDAELAGYGRIILGFPVWAGSFAPPLRSFVSEHAETLRGRRVAVFACQSGAGAEKALARLRKAIGLDAFDATGVFIDPKTRPSAEAEAAIEAFIARL